MRDHDYTISSEFLAEFFGSTTEHAVELRSLPNDRGAMPAKPLFGRDLPLVEAHCRRWDGPGRAMYFGVCTRITGAPTGTRTDLAECPAMWAEVDTRKLELDKDAVRQAAMTSPHAPCLVLDSGGGLHFYWLLTEAIDVRQDGPDAAETEDAIVAVLKQLAGIIAGDAAVCDLARIVRLPGTHNTKPEVMADNGGAPVPVTLLVAHWTRRHEFSDLVDWLDWQRPVVTIPGAADSGRTAVEDNPYLAAAKQLRFTPPLDVEKALAAMTYLGTGDTGIHQTQLRVSASLVAQGIPDEEIVTLLMANTLRAAGPHGRTWNWRREERTLRTMIATARTKFVKATATPAQPLAAAPEVVAERTEAQVINLGTERRKRERKPAADKDTKAELIKSLGEMVIRQWQAQRGPLLISDNALWTYQAGVWSRIEDHLELLLRGQIQAAVDASGKAPTTGLLNAVLRYIGEHWRLMRDAVPWDQHGLVVARNGAIDPITRQVQPHTPEHHATWAVSYVIDPDSVCPRFLQFLADITVDHPTADRAGLIGTIQEWFGAALVLWKSREISKGLFVIGESRSGKTQLAEIARALVGGRTCGMRARQLEEHFGMQPLVDARAWIADDAVSTGDTLDAERYKVIVTAEHISVPRKHKPDWEGRLGIPVLFTANHLPRVKDNSEAVYNRTLILRLLRVFPETMGGQEPVSAPIIRDELPGVLNWALEGLDRLLKRGRFAPPACMLEETRQFQATNNPIGEWLRECVERQDFTMVDRRDVIASCNGWLVQEYGDCRPIGGRAIIPALRLGTPSAGDHKSDGRRFVTGLRLNDQGLTALDTYQKQNPNRLVGSGETLSQVNRVNPKAERPAGRQPRF